MRDRGQQQQAYPPNMTSLLAAIRQDDGFWQKPIGPMGSHVRLLKPSWSNILEKSFGGALEAFVVISKEDQLRLSAMMRRLNWLVLEMVDVVHTLTCSKFLSDFDHQCQSH